MDTDKMIEAIKRRPCLWDTTSAQYVDRQLKYDSWLEVVQEVSDIPIERIEDIEKQVPLLQTRWKSLCSCFKRELKNQKKSPKSASPGFKRKKYHFYESLLFLLPVIKSRSKSIIKQISESEKDDEESTASEPRVPSFILESDKQVQRQKQIRKRESSPYAKSNFDIIETRRMDNDDGTNIDEDKLFLLSLLPSLKRLRPELKSSVKLKFQQIMHETLYGDPNQSSGPSFYSHASQCNPYAVSLYAQTPFPEVVTHNSNRSHSESNTSSPTAAGPSLQ